MNIIPSPHYNELSTSQENQTYTLPNIPTDEIEKLSRPKYGKALNEWVDLRILDWWDPYTDTYYEFSHTMLNDPDIPGPPIAYQMGHIDPKRQEYVGSVSTDIGKLLLNRYYLEVDVIFYTTQTVNDLYGQYTQSWKSVKLAGIRYNGAPPEDQYDKVNAFINLPYFPVDDFRVEAGPAKTGEIIMQCFVNTEYAQGYFHNFEVNASTGQKAGDLTYQDSVYCYLESVNMKNNTIGYVENINKEYVTLLLTDTINAVSGIGRPTYSGTAGEDYGRTDIPQPVDWKDELGDRITEDKPPRSQELSKASYRIASGVTASGWYIAPAEIVTEQEGHLVQGPVINSKPLTYVLDHNDPNNNITHRGEVIDTNLLDRYGNIDTIIFGIPITLKPDVTQFSALHSMHTEQRLYKHDFWGDRKSAGFVAIEPYIEKCVSGFEVNNVYLRQTIEFSLIIGAYYKWEPIAPQYGALGDITYSQGTYIYSAIPTGAQRADTEAEFEFLPPAIKKLLQAALTIGIAQALGVAPAELGGGGLPGLGGIGSFLGGLVPIVVVIVIVIVIALVGYAIYKYTQSPEYQMKQWEKKQQQMEQREMMTEERRYMREEQRRRREEERRRREEERRRREEEEYRRREEERRRREEYERRRKEEEGEYGKY